MFSLSRYESYYRSDTICKNKGQINLSSTATYDWKFLKQAKLSPPQHAFFPPRSRLYCTSITITARVLSSQSTTLAIIFFTTQHLQTPHCCQPTGEERCCKRATQHHNHTHHHHPRSPDCRKTSHSKLRLGVKLRR
jgi:hypothetical protein